MKSVPNSGRGDCGYKACSQLECRNEHLHLTNRADSNGAILQHHFEFKDMCFAVDNKTSHDFAFYNVQGVFMELPALAAMAHVKRRTIILYCSVGNGEAGGFVAHSFIPLNRDPNLAIWHIKCDIYGRHYEALVAIDVDLALFGVEALGDVHELGAVCSFLFIKRYQK